MSGQCDKYGSYQSLTGHAKINHDLGSLLCRLFKKRYIRTFGLGFA